MTLAPRAPSKGRDVNTKKRLTDSRPTSYQLQETSVSDVRFVGLMVKQLIGMVESLNGKVVAIAMQMQLYARGDQLVVTNKAIEELTAMVQALKQSIEDGLEQESQLITAIESIVAKFDAAIQNSVSLEELKAWSEKQAANKSRLAVLAARNTPADTGTPVPPAV